MKIKLITLILLGFVSTLFAEKRWVGDYEIDDYNDGVAITGYNGSDIDLVIPNTLDGKDVMVISYGAFSNKGLESVSFPSTIDSISDNSFTGNYNLDSIYFEENSHLRYLSSFAFSSSITFKLPTSGITNFVTYKRSNSDMYETDYFNEGYLLVLSIYYESSPIILTAISSPQVELQDEDVVVKNGVLTSADTKGALSINIPNTLDGQTVTAIGEWAFEEEDLFSVTLPITIQFIYDYAFYDNNLLEVLFEGESNLKQIYSTAFSGNDNLDSIQLPTSTIEGFKGYSDDEGNYYSEGDYISDMYNTYTAIFTYTLQDDDVTVESGIITSVEAIGASDIIIPEILSEQTIIGLEDNIFKGANISSIILPNSLEEIGNSTFYNNNIETIVLPMTIEKIGSSAFSKNNIDSLFIPNSINIIGNYAFNSNNLTKVDFEDASNLKQIGYYAFNGNDNLQSIQLPTSTIEGFLEYTNSSGTINYEGDNISNFENSYTANFPYTLQEGDVIIESGIIISTNKYGGALTIPDRLNDQYIIGIGDEAFMNKGITDLTLPSTLLTIGANAFSGNEIVELLLPSAINRIDVGAFSDNQISNIEFPNSLTAISLGAFRSNQLTSVEIPYGVETIGDRAFGGNPLENITLPNSIIKIGYYALSYIEYTLPTPQKEGYRLRGWDYIYYSDVSNFPAGSTISSYQGIEAIFEANTYTLNYNANGGQGSMEASTEIEYMTSTTLPLNSYVNPPFIFAGWSNTPNGPTTYSDRDYYTMRSEGAELYAKWELPSYIISYENEGDLYYMYKTNNYPSTSPLPTTPEKEGYTFAGWYTQENGQGTTFSTETIITEDITVYANWTEGTTAIKSLSANSLEIHPNPSSDYIVIQGIDNEEEVNIYTSNGVLISTRTEVTSNTSINISSLPVGVYTVKIGSRSEKLIVE